MFLNFWFTFMIDWFNFNLYFSINRIIQWLIITRILLCFFPIQFVRLDSYVHKISRVLKPWILAYKSGSCWSITVYKKEKIFFYSENARISNQYNFKLANMAESSLAIGTITLDLELSSKISKYRRKKRLLKRLLIESESDNPYYIRKYLKIKQSLRKVIIGRKKFQALMLEHYRSKSWNANSLFYYLLIT